MYFFCRIYEVFKNGIITLVLFNHKLKLKFFVKIINKLYEILTNYIYIITFQKCVKLSDI